MGEKKMLSILKEQERDVRRNLILDAAERLFSANSFDKVSMQEIANEAQLSKSSIYTYFQNQEELFIEAALRDGAILQTSLLKMTERKDSTIENVIDAFIEFFVNHDSFFRMASLLMLQGNLSEESIAKVHPVIRGVMEVFDTVIRRMNYRGDVRLLSHTLFSALSGILISYRNYPSRTESEKMRHMKRLGTTVRDMVKALIKTRK
ncbi:MAG: TetR/AcrR family transcriptional regulator [Spirochaetes bacterium]|nr:MAG: TetR/AcrR family transcriptional regulator [Spirochaetota bacterium]